MNPKFKIEKEKSLLIHEHPTKYGTDILDLARRLSDNEKRKKSVKLSDFYGADEFKNFTGERREILIFWYLYLNKTFNGLNKKVFSSDKELKDVISLTFQQLEWGIFYDHLTRYQESCIDENYPKTAADWAYERKTKSRVGYTIKKELMILEVRRNLGEKFISKVYDSLK